MKTVTHRSRNHAQMGAKVFPVTSFIDDDPAAQELIKRLGEACGTGHSVSIDVHQHVTAIAAVVMRGRAK